jgi:large subunit ribosomal protein L5
MASSKGKKGPRLFVKYHDEIVQHLTKTFSYKNVMQVPRLKKIVINMGVGEATQDAKFLEGAVEDLTIISGQKAVMTHAKKAISNFKLREGVPIGCRVTLRRFQMYEFLDRLLNVAIPRVRDFRGVSNNSFDGRGNYNLGIREQIIFPEINYDKVVKIRGFNISFVTTASGDEETFELLKAFGMPFRKKENL